MKTSFLRESNKKIFQNLPFFQTLTDSTLLQLAEKIEMFIAHPEQVIEKNEGDSRVLILKQGKIAFCSKMRGSNYNKSVVNKIEVKKEGSPALVELDFINPVKTKNYEVHSK